MKTICDKCMNYTRSLNGCSDYCHEHMRNPFYITKYYFENRFQGKNKSCKGFSSLPYKEV